MPVNIPVLSVAYDALRKMGLQFLEELPRFLVAAIIVLILYYAGSALRWTVMRGTHRWRGRLSLELAIGRLFHAIVIAVAIVIAAMIAFPSFTVGGLVQLLGVSSIAIGFAFKDIFQNFLAGILLLITEPFDIGDQITVDAYEGTVETIHTRATLITTYDNRRIVVPNADLFTKSVTVNTAFPLRRQDFEITLGADTDVDAMKRRIVDRLKRGVRGVATDPAPDVLLVKFDPSGVTLRVRWWSPSERSASLEVQDGALRAIREVTTAAK